MQSVAIPKCSFSEPRFNLPHMRKGVASNEDRFTISFARAYSNKANTIHKGTNKTERFMAREVAINGYGITDLLVVAWQPSCSFEFQDVTEFALCAKPTVRAFEMKLSNWRKAMQQASRYRNFAHQPIVVLPIKEFEKAIEYADTFQTIRVGLWGFDNEKGQIHSFYTPRPRKPRSERYYLESISKAYKAASPALPIV